MAVVAVVVLLLLWFKDKISGTAFLVVIGIGAVGCLVWRACMEVGMVSFAVSTMNLQSAVTHEHVSQNYLAAAKEQTRQTQWRFWTAAVGLLTAVIGLAALLLKLLPF